MAHTFKGYVNYGCLAAEKRKVWTADYPAFTAAVSDEVEYTVPDGWDMGHNAVGNVIITTPWGVNYMVNDLLGGNEAPCFMGIDPDGKKFSVELEYKEIA